jgi:predicted O-methyltransferase YrrM
MAQDHLSAMGRADVVTFHVAEAVRSLRETDGPFDIIFNDIDKEGYPDSLPVIKEKLRHGGLLIIDNMLWHGQILDSDDHEKSTEAIRGFTRDITTDLDWIVSLIPARDGMIVAYKK